VGLLLLRVVAGLALALAHGIGKVPPSQRFVDRVGNMGFPAPEIFAWLAAAAEVGAALLVAVGLLTRPVGAILAGYMLLIAFIAHAGDPFGAREKAVLFATISATLALTGGGRYSLDALVRKRLSRPEGT
jgi:putative oxidoreductase